MAAPVPRQRRLTEVIDLVSSDDDERVTYAPPARPAPRTVVQMDMDSDTSSDTESVRYATPPLASDNPGQDTPEQHAAQLDQQRLPGGTIMLVDGEEVFIPDEADAPSQAPADLANDPGVARDRELALSLDNVQEVTADTCLQRVLEIFPDISHEYVYNLYNDFDHGGDYETLPGPARMDNIIEQLVSATNYPKQEKGKKRKRENSFEEDPLQKWEREDRVAVPKWLKGSMQAIMKAEFPDIPVQYIADTLVAQRHLYQGLIALAKTQDDGDNTTRPYGRGRPSTKHLADAATIAGGCGWPELLDELNAARKRIQIIRSERAAEEVKKLAEQENLRRATAAGETAECSACFDDLPMNRQIHCNGLKAHFLCFDCADTYIKSEIGESRCRVVCPAAECGSGYASHQLNLLSDKQSLEKLAQLQQEKDIRDAGLDDLEECPFCDYKAILPPVEEDFEFRCANQECEKVSCRRCKAVSHIPVSCEQHAKDNKVNSRHKIEEAMTAALVRSCNKCKKQFIKEYGCNKMTCPSCHNLQCYVCSATLKDYNHFDQNPGRTVESAGNTNRSKCPLYDNVEERHEREVKEAEAKAREQVVQDNPDVSIEDLEIKVSEAVKTATANRIRQGGDRVGVMALGFPHPPPPLPGFFGVFDGANDEDFNVVNPNHPHAYRPIPVHGIAAAARRRRANDAPLVPELRGPNAGQQEVGARNAFVLHQPAPPPPPAQPFQNPAVGQAGHVQGYIPVLGYQAALQAQPAPVFAGQFGFNGPFVPLGPPAPVNNAFRPGIGEARATNGYPDANGFHNVLNNRPANRDGPPQIDNHVVQNQAQNFQQIQMQRMAQLQAFRAQRQALVDRRG